MLDKVIFYFFAAIAVSSAALMVTRRNAVHSAIFLITTLLATAGIFLQLRAEFIFIVQIILYVGGIMVLFIFVIMLLNAGEEERTNFSTLATYGGVPLALAIAGLIAAALSRAGTEALPAAAQGGAVSSTRSLSMLLFSEFVYPFELTSFLILVAILGAIVLAQREN
jgi:NADH-quinone oxidoreductase subunit J